MLFVGIGHSCMAQDQDVKVGGFCSIPLSTCQRRRRLRIGGFWDVAGVLFAQALESFPSRCLNKGAPSRARHQTTKRAFEGDDPAQHRKSPGNCQIKGGVDKLSEARTD